MSYAKPLYSRTDVNVGGRQFALGEGDINHCLKVIDNFRASHAHPLSAFYMTLKRRARSIVPNALVVQRIMRLEPIAAKLRSKPTMRLTQMQDIGGCRAVMPSVELVRRLQTMYRVESLVHTLSNTKDYIALPKETGYRGAHPMYTISRGENPGPYAGLKIEIQIRTRLQHKWATAVEAAETFTGQALKPNLGSEEWRRFFALMSSVFALREGSPTVPGTSDDFLVLCEEIRQLDTVHHMANVFAGYRAILPHVEQPRRSLLLSSTGPSPPPCVCSRI